MTDLPARLHDVVAPARHRHRHLVEPASRWATAHLRWLPADLAALVVDVRLTAPPSESTDDLGTASWWTRLEVTRVLTDGVDAWCAARHIPVPARFPEALWRFLDFLAATGRLDPRSDPVVELRRPLRCVGELDATGRWRRDTDHDPGPCVCFEPYVGPSHGARPGVPRTSTRAGGSPG